MTDAIPTAKICPDCGCTKPLDEYYKDNSRKDKRTAYCRDCTKGRNNSPHARAARNARYRELHPPPTSARLIYAVIWQHHSPTTFAR